jgi:alkylation response protein AidB-like acyl-CoA dehydrogenase
MPYKTFGFTEEQILMRDSVLGLLERVLPPEKISAQDKASEYPHESFKALADAGWLTLPFDEAYGGMGAGYKDFAVFIEALGYHYPGIRTAYMTTVVYGGLYIQNLGSEALKQEFLPPIMKGERRMAVAMTEPQSGSDVAGIRLRATRDGDGYVLNGQKVYITNAHESDYLVVAVKTDPEAGRKGISLVIVDTTDPGFEARPMDPLGGRSTLLNEVFFDDVRVPASLFLGEENGGWKGLMQGLNLERILIAAAASGQCLKIIEIAKQFVEDRKAFGKRIADFQAVAHKFAEMAMMTETARLHTYSTAEMLDAGEDAIQETAMAKVVATENNFKVADLGVHIMGAAGYVQGDMQRLFRDARLGTIGGGTSDILRNVIAQRMEL